MSGSSVHASAVLIGDAAVLIRGPSGSGKSRLAFALVLAGRARQIPASVLVGDDRVDLSGQAGRLIVRPVPALAGLIELRGLGIRRCAFAPSAPVRWVVDLAASDAERLPARESMQIIIQGVTLDRLPIGAGFDPMPLVLGALLTAPSGSGQVVRADCPQDIGNHMRSTLTTP